MKHAVAALCALLALALSLGGCTKKPDSPSPAGGSPKLVVIATLFPLLDFARTIGGDKTDVSLLSPPGVEMHHFQPRPDDVVRVRSADLFLFTNRYMEPWAHDFARNAAAPKLLLVDAGAGATFLKSGAPPHTHDHHDDHARQEPSGAGMDPHIWLDFSNARIMAHNIAAALISRDPANRDYYQRNEAALMARLAALDGDYARGLANCASRTLLHGGHYAFGYLAARYNLRYESAAAVNADAEPTPARIVELVGLVRRHGLRYVFSEELLSPRVSETIAREAGVAVLPLNGAHTVSRRDFDAGVTFESIMRKNLDNLRIGLGCS